MQKILMISSFVRPNESFEFERYFLSITTMSNLKILMISITFTIQAKTSVERTQMGFSLVWMSKFHLIAFQIKLVDLLDTLNRWFLLEFWKFSKLLEFSDCLCLLYSKNNAQIQKPGLAEHKIISSRFFACMLTKLSTTIPEILGFIAFQLLSHR